MLIPRRKADINQREDREMVAFIAIVGLIIGVANMSFQQGKRTLTLRASSRATRISSMTDLLINA
jgi:hypothetical protein